LEKIAITIARIPKRHKIKNKRAKRIFNIKLSEKLTKEQRGGR